MASRQLSKSKQPNRKPHIAFTEARKSRYLRRLAETGARMQSAEWVGVSYDAVTFQRKNDPEFAAAFDLAVDRAAESFEQEAIRRGVEGVEEYVVSGGQIVEIDVKVGKKIERVPLKKRVYSDGLLIRLLQGNIPDKYGNKIEADVTVGGGVLVVPAALSPDEFVKQVRADEAKRIEHKSG